MVRVNGSVFSILFVSASLSLTACAPSNSSSSSGGGATAQSSSKSIYAGTWVKPCVVGAISSTREKLVITDTTVDMISETFASTNCSGSSVLDAIARADYVLRSDVGLPGSAKAVDLTLRKLLLVSHNAIATEKMNSDANCGITDWVTNQERDIINTSCNTSAQIFSGAVSYSSITLVGSTLYRGKADGTDSGTSEATREVEAESIGYVKQ